jgi:hypothetical protein
VREVETWRAARERRMRSDEGWLTVAGLSWLNEGPSVVGTDPAAAVVLPEGSAPARAAVLHRRGRDVTVEIPAGVVATSGVGGPPVTAGTRLRTDMDPGGPDVIVLGRIRFFLIARADRIGVRVRDLSRPERARFQGLRWFPIAPAFRVVARFVPHATPVTMRMPNVLGFVEDLPSPGVAELTIGGRTARLHAVLEAPGAEQLFFVFKDTAKDTYPAGRFLYADLPRDGAVILDFNKAFTPPCAYTPFATCLLPPKENRLPFAIPAGERSPAGAH